MILSLIPVLKPHYATYSMQRNQYKYRNTRRERSGWVDCRTKVIPLSHPSADQWEFKAPVFPVSIVSQTVTSSRLRGAHESMTAHRHCGNVTCGWSYRPFTWPKNYSFFFRSVQVHFQQSSREAKKWWMQFIWARWCIILCQIMRWQPVFCRLRYQLLRCNVLPQQPYGWHTLTHIQNALSCKFIILFLFSQIMKRPDTV